MRWQSLTYTKCERSSAMMVLIILLFLVLIGFFACFLAGTKNPYDRAADDEAQLAFLHAYRARQKARRKSHPRDRQSRS